MVLTIPQNWAKRVLSCKCYEYFHRNSLLPVDRSSRGYLVGMAVSFDRIANIYDSTRWSGIPSEVMKRILTSIRDAFKDCHLVLDVGIGTGRFAEFLKGTGLTVVGVDVSLSMMRQARQKGIKDLVRADARLLPFRDQSIDGSLMIHVLHLVHDWVNVIHEVGRVTRRIVVSEAGDSEGFSARQKYLEVREKMGYPLRRLNDGEFGLRRIVPPSSIVSAGDFWTEVDAKEEITSFEARKSSVMWDVPNDIHKRIIERLHTEYDGKTLRQHDIPEVVSWDPAQFRSLISKAGQK